MLIICGTNHGCFIRSKLLQSKSSNAQIVPNTPLVIENPAVPFCNLVLARIHSTHHRHSLG